MRVSLACGAQAGRGPGMIRTQLSARSLQQSPPSPPPPPAQSTRPPPPPRLASAPRIPEPDPAGIPGPTGTHSPAEERPEITIEPERLCPLDLDDARVTGFFNHNKIHINVVALTVSGFCGPERPPRAAPTVRPKSIFSD